jgi:carboxyl-terminal processing protease
MQTRLSALGFTTLGMVAGALLSPVLFAIAAEGIPSPFSAEQLRPFTEVFAKIKTDYVDAVDDGKLMQACIGGMVAGVDPNSSYLDAVAYKELQTGTEGALGGVGLELGMEDGFLKVVAPIDDTPAARGGIRPGDLIIRIDDTWIKGMTLIDAVRSMRGKPNTPVTFTIVRKSEPKPFLITLTRAAINILSVRSKLIESGYAYVRISQFQESTGGDLAKQLIALYRQGHISGIVLDLRNNPGGVIHSAIGVAAAFLSPASLIAYTDGRIDDAKRKYTAAAGEFKSGRGDFLKDIPAEARNVPLVVLVNGGTSAGSEIVAGAFQDYKRATIIGTPTFGYSSIQTIMPLMNGTAMKLTTARWFTPNGRSAAGKGIVPDVPYSGQPVEPGQIGSSNDIQLVQAVALLKSGR